MSGRKRRRNRSKQHDSDGEGHTNDTTASKGQKETHALSTPRVTQPKSIPRESKRPKTTTMEDATATLDIAGGASNDATLSTQDVPHPRSHSYGTRARNQFRRPGQDVGLDWEETRKEKEAADAARAQKKAQEDIKKARLMAASQHEREGINRIAALELSREQEDVDEHAYMGRTGTARGYLSASSKASMVQAASPSAYDAGHRHGSGSEYQDDAVSSSSEYDSPGEDGEPADDPADEMMAPAPLRLPTKKKPKTAAERKREKQKQVRGRIADARDAMPKKPGHNAGRSQAASAAATGINHEYDDHDPPDPRPTKRNVGRARSATAAADDHDDDHDDGEDAFRPAYRAVLLQKTVQLQAARATPDRAARDARTPTSVAPTPFQLRLRIPGSPSSPVPARSAPRAATPIQDDGSRGLDDEDVTLSREMVVERPRGRQVQTLQIVHTEPEPLQKPKAKRTSQADMEPANSLSGKNLPRWIKDEFDNNIIPTILEHFGAQEDPWTLDPQKPTKGKVVHGSSSVNASEGDPGIVDIVQQLITQLFPRKQYQLASNDIIVRVARQRVLNWRRAFLDRAIKAAAAAYTQFKTQHPDATKRAVADWADGAMDVNSGFGLWEIPATAKDPKPRGGLRSTYLLRTFAPHFNSIRGSVLADSPPPIGALSLALAALEIAFDCYQSGVLQAPESNFDIASAGVATQDWYKLAVLPNLTPSERWDMVMDVAKQHAPRGPSSSKSRAPARKRRSGVMPGSSPVRPESM